MKYSCKVSHTRSALGSLNICVVENESSYRPVGASDGSGIPETRVSGFGSALEKWVGRQVEQGFS